MLAAFLAAIAVHQASPEPIPGQLVREILGTASLTHTVRRDRGEIAGCENVFRVLAQDNLYANGNLIAIDGSISLITLGDGGTVGSIKISGSDVFMVEGQPLTVPYESNFGYFLNAETGEPYAVLSSFQCEDGGYCAAVDLETLLGVLSELVALGRIEGALNRAGGETDLPFMVEATDTNWKFDEFADCAERLISRQLPAE